MPTSVVYRLLVRSGVALAPAFTRGRPKLAAGIAERAGLIGRLRSWAASRRDLTRPLLWMHAASVGEGLQAGAVLALLRQRHPDWQSVATHTSPSAAQDALAAPADLAECLPWDRASDVEAALEVLRPSALVFCKHDLWPELATRAAARGIPVGLIGAAVHPAGRRLRWPTRGLLLPGYRVVRAAGAVSLPDAGRLVRLGVPADRIVVTGDPRCDSALARARAIRADDPLLLRLGGGETLVAGSTWPEDEAALLAAFGIVRAARPQARLVLVPHEPTTEALARVTLAAGALGFDAARPNDPGGPHPLTVVDRVGILATLYAGATIAYVGGGFGRAGLHSVLEPAACGVPVLFGPRGFRNPDAAALLAAHAAAQLGPEFPDWLDLDVGSTNAGANPLAALWLALLRHPAHAAAAGRRGLDYVEAGAGAALRNAELIEGLVERARS